VRLQSSKLGERLSTVFTNVRSVEMGGGSSQYQGSRYICDDGLVLVACVETHVSGEVTLSPEGLGTRFASPLGRDQVVFINAGSDSLPWQSC
jgi:hypothetical protein